MGIKKIARPINKAKNEYLKWLKNRGAECIDDFGVPQEKDGWDYYRHVSAFVGDTFYNVYFKMFYNKVKIDYSDDYNTYKDMSIDEFMQLIS